MPICYYCNYEIKEFNLQDDEPGDEYTVMSRNGEEIAVCEACMTNLDTKKVSRRR